MLSKHIHHKIYGPEGAPVVVLIHGFNSNSQTWLSTIPALAKKYRVLIYDQPGHGRSGVGKKDYSPTYLADLLCDLLDRLKISAAYIVGHSMGGRTALSFAARYKRKTLGLVIEDMHISSSKDSVDAIAKAKNRYEVSLGNIKNYYSSKALALKDLLKYYSLAESIWVIKATAQSDRGIELPCRPASTELYLHEGLALDMKPELRSIECSIQFYAADSRRNSTMLKKEQIDTLKAVRPNIPVRVFEGRSHSIHEHQEFSGALFDILNKFDRLKKIP